MFSGIVEEVGTVQKIEDSADGKTITIEAKEILEDAKMGESISVSGTCLTVIQFDQASFTVEATIETLRCTSLNKLKTGSKVNLEKALKVNDRLGGHMVTGHVDTVGRVVDVVEEGFSKVFKFALEPKWASFFVKKGSVTVEGVSLTVVDCSSITDNSCKDDFWFTVALIPHTMSVTTLGNLGPGDPVNIETDVIARYVVRLVGEGYLQNLNKPEQSVLFQGKEG